MKTNIDLESAQKYIKSIRNLIKRQYARDYLEFLINKTECKEANYPIAYMAKHGVRLELCSYLK
jgi:hypothetical protein